jgi:hypothetical protein
MDELGVGLTYRFLQAVIPMLLQHHCGRWGWPCLVVNLFMAVTDIEFWTWSMPFSLDLLAQHPADLRLFAWGFDGGAGCKHYYCSNNNYHCPFPLPSAQDFNSGTPFRHSYSMAMASCMTFSPSETYVLCSSPFRTRPSPLCTPLTGCNGCNGMQWDAMGCNERNGARIIPTHPPHWEEPSPRIFQEPGHFLSSKCISGRLMQ